MATAADNLVFFDHDAANSPANEAPTLPPGGARGRSVVPFPESRPSSVDPGVLGFPAGLLAHLPVPVALEVGLLSGLRFAVVLDDEQAERRRSMGERVLDAADWEVLVTAAESDRLRGIDLPDLLAARREGPLRLDAVLGGARPDPVQGWSVARVLSRLELVIHAAGIASRPALELAA
jgi:hypothetical protein